MPFTLNRGRTKKNLATPGGAMRILTIRVRAFKRSEKLMMLIIINIISIRRRYKATQHL